MVWGLFGILTRFRADSFRCFPSGQARQKTEPSSAAARTCFCGTEEEAKKNKNRFQSMMFGPILRHILALLMLQKPSIHQLRLVVYPMISRVLYIPGGWPWDFFHGVHGLLSIMDPHQIVPASGKIHQVLLGEWKKRVCFFFLFQTSSF